ncbi:hypothetical protein [Nitrobacter winogradskyi]|uniref:Uncharacterized protein n=1 Tax=Nitrobacter winogradskyi TaxID=913 RepID=A0ACC6AFZ8_NITWI|nr:hypothetical protein [Nitrobacter winogradskyi]MCP1997895.1 hypothetical protein [Nitrobacter winogradskyi]
MIILATCFNFAPPAIMADTLGSFRLKVRTLPAKLIWRAQGLVLCLVISEPLRSLIAFSSEADTGSREETASEQQFRASLLIQPETKSTGSIGLQFQTATRQAAIYEGRPHHPEGYVGDAAR